MGFLAGKNHYRFKGHESFTIREGWLNKGLLAVAKDAKVFMVNAGADALGVGANMAKSIRYWMRCAGLMEEVPKEGAKFTWLGELLKEKDCYFEEDLSLWLVHCNIVKNKEEATAWNLFFNQFSYEEFDKKILTDEMKELAKRVVGDGKLAESSVENDCEAIMHMYLKKSEKGSNPEEKNISPFGKYQLLKRTDGMIQRKQPDLNQLPEEVVWYLLKEQIADANSISMDALLDGENSPGKLLQLKRTGLMEMLGRLETRELITINHTAGLDMVYLKSDQSKQQVIKDYYDRKKKGR